MQPQESAIVWHYRSAADPAFAAWTARELLHTLNAMNRNQHFDTIPGAKILEARASGADKGSALERLLVDGARSQAPHYSLSLFLPYIILFLFIYLFTRLHVS
eukprot:tig00021532_g22190.t1